MITLTRITRIMPMRAHKRRSANQGFVRGIRESGQQR